MTDREKVLVPRAADLLYSFAMHPRLVLISFLLLNAAVASEFPEVYNSEPDATAEPPTAQEALEMWDLPEGFSVTLFASEPDVRNPIAMAWDWKGRMWVAENYTYAERQTRFELGLKDRVLILEDEDWDGKADKRTVFTEDVQMLTSVEVGKGGVWLMCPPQLLFIPDRDGDDVPDGSPEVVLDGFTVAESNYHNFANGLRWGPDGWLYGRCGHSCPGKVGLPGTPEEDRIPIEGGIWRFHPERKVFEGIAHGTTNPWGHGWDENGELFFINTVNGHLWHGITGAHFKESFGADPNPYVFDRLDMHADHWHFDTSGKWSESRDGAANEFGGGHAHVGMMVYQGDKWPEEFRDRLYTMNMHGFRANRERLDREDSGYVARHEPDVFFTKDKWFRGIDIRQAADGSVFVLDWSDTGECHEHTGVHRTSGRIYRISYGEVEKPDYSWTEELGETLSAQPRHPVPWEDEGLLSKVGDPTAENLRKVAMSGQETTLRLRAMWALHALGAKRSDWIDFCADDDEHIRSWAIRLITDDLPIDTVLGARPKQDHEPLREDVLSQFNFMAEKDESGLVRLALASTLQRLDLDQREALASALVAHAEDADDHNLPSMVWYGICPLAEQNPMALVRIAENSAWPDTLRWTARALSIQIEEKPEPLDALITFASTLDASMQSAILSGVSEGLQGWRKAPKPESWDSLMAAMGSSDKEELTKLTRDLSVLFGDGRALDEIKKVALDAQGDPSQRKAAIETLIDARPDDLRKICESLLGDRQVNAVAVKGLALFDDPKLGKALASQYRRFSQADKSSVMEVLVSRPEWAQAMLEEMKAGRIPRTDLSAFQARQIRSFEKEDLGNKLAESWGELRESSEDKRKLIEEWTGKLSSETLSQADLSQGRMLFAGICGSCHVMYGEGGKIGPDLTGSNRTDLGYLLENIFDPSGVVSADFRMTMLTLKDGRVLTGVVSEENEKTLTLRQASEETRVEKSEVEKRDVSPLSMMPEGLLLAITEDQVRDLIAYLMHPTQVALPGQ